MLDRTTCDWWKDAVIYQIYPKSFQDSNGDGIGDLPGIISRLPYLQKLGADAIWLSPIFASPQKDNGYDISDYRRIDPRFGSMEDFEELVREGDKRGIGVILDLVLNHTSDLHPWFQEARKSRDSEYHDWYIWRDGTPGVPPDDLPAIFGGSAWFWEPEVSQYYYSTFSAYQPDLNWENPQVRRALYDMIRFWLDKGVAGFRLDAIGHISKDLPNGVQEVGPRLHDYLKEMRREAFPDQRVLAVGEAGHDSIDEVRSYANADGSELSMVFEFDLADFEGRKWELEAPEPADIREFFALWQQGLHDVGWNALFLENHDQPRVVSKWGSERLRRESATMLAALMFGLEGTPYIYQGSEIGMTNCSLTIEEHDDLAVRSDYEEGIALGLPEEQVTAWIDARNRDNARTPMQWDDGPNAGFTTGTPWLPVNPNYREINVRREESEPDSVLHFYRELIALRREYEVLRRGKFYLIGAGYEQIISYVRSLNGAQLLVLCNYSSQETDVDIPEAFEGGRLLLCNYEGESERLRPYEARYILAP